LIDKHKYTVDVIVPTYNAAKYLDGLLGSIEDCSANSINSVYFVDSSSSDGTAELIRQRGFENVTEIEASDFDHGGTRGGIAKASRGDIVVFLTQDALLADEFSIEKLVSVFEDPKIGAAYGRQLPYEWTNRFGEFLRKFNYPDESYVRAYSDKDKFGIKVAFLSNSFAAYRREYMDEIGWFKNNLILGEDAYAGAKLLKLGYKIAYVADAVVYHSHSYTILQEFKRYFDIGVFHRMEYWLIEEFGKPEGEGLRYIKEELRFLIKKNDYLLIVVSFFRNIFKYLGYKLGINYHRLPDWLIKRISMHHRWWNKFSGH